MGRTISRCEDFISIMMLEQDHPPSGTSGANFQPTVRGERGSSEQHEGARQDTFPHHPALRSQVKDIKNVASIHDNSHDYNFFLKQFFTHCPHIVILTSYDLDFIFSVL